VTEQAWLPQGVDADRPTDARVHDYALGGKDNYAVDRAYGHRLLEALPHIDRAAVENAKFARRAIRYLRSIGVDQFLDIGSGMPRRGNVHDVAGPESTVVYVDYDPVVVGHYQALLDGDPAVTAVHANVTEPARILGDPAVEAMIDSGRPVGLLMTYLLQLVTDDQDPAGIMRSFREALPPGSHLVLSHGTSEEMSPEQLTSVDEIFEELRERVRLRSAAEIGAFFDGYDLLPPGLVRPPDWRPDRPYRPATDWLLAGVGRKRSA
jgi:hypothetical protein